ncbi:putative nucleoside-diphosphate-sugar epimerase [Aspergillus alliaceus]|uniref:putative nucleoside-diphosphate-sugar epimerase n=1 Tax=Petromyces alliaceus TaxID=209559 RepID=UPI0012A3BBE3|nr:uncharacterized protein BDW43DRAFT_240654 [Aspergillus alliaceus]KAB8236567.1 hypothetical protein BDW43DRAFT_240654 [Aspergillus alliaceus]
MKVILTGSTGFIGCEVLKQCLQNPSITSIVAFSRRDLPPTVTHHPKLTVRIVNDFLSFSDAILEDIKGAGACIWTLGKAVMTDMEMARKIHIEYTLSSLEAFHRAVASGSQSPMKFRFVYCSGAVAERDQSKPLWFAQEYRRIRGEVENQLIASAENHRDTIETYILRPAMVVSRELTLRSLIFGLGPSIKVDVLAGVMLDIALHGHNEKILENFMMDK